MNLNKDTKYHKYKEYVSEHTDTFDIAKNRKKFLILPYRDPPDYTTEPTESIYPIDISSIEPTCYPSYAPTFVPTPISTNMTINSPKHTYDQNVYYITVSITSFCFFLMFLYLYKIYYINRYKIYKLQQKSKRFETHTDVRYTDYNSVF
uniref:Uncharacterized protein n=1 Tax=viral metagenome TaxID=1070528 RepID=A0A6C0HHR5_9ZZZZ